jgi:high-affinity nickel-transport protein
MQEGKRSVTAGFFFSLGHSTVVVLATIAVAATAVALQRHFHTFKSVGSIIGTSVSAVFLLVIGIINWRSCCGCGGVCNTSALAANLNPR